MKLTEVLETKLSEQMVADIANASQEAEVSMSDFIKSRILEEKKDLVDEDLKFARQTKITTKDEARKFIIEKQKKVAASILYTLASEGNPQAIVAGGAPRNWMMGEPANDIDIYFTNPISKELVHKIADREELRFLGKQYDRYGMVKGITSVVEANIQETKVQFITTKRFGYTKEQFAQSIFDSFDFGICKIGWTPDGYITTPEFHNDRCNKKLTIDIEKLSKHNSFLSLPKRLIKMKKYYPDHELDIV